MKFLHNLINRFVPSPQVDILKTIIDENEKINKKLMQDNKKLFEYTQQLKEDNAGLLYEIKVLNEMIKILKGDGK